MTAAVGSAASGGAEALLQSVSGKASSGYRGHVKQTDENDPKSEGATQSEPRDDVDAAAAHADKLRKTSQRKHGKNKSDDDDSSFEDAFDSIGQDQAKDTVLKSANGAGTSPNLVAAQLTPDRTLATNTDSVATKSDISQAPVRAAALMQQKSILALMDAKNKIFANSADLKTDDATDNVAVDHDAIPQDTTELIPVAINRRETHWNFSSDAVTSVASQLSAMNTDKAAPSSATVLAQTVASVTMAKDQKSDAKSTSDAPQFIAPTAEAANPDQNTNASLGNDSGNKGDAQSHTEIALEAAKKTEKPDAASSLEQIFTTSKSSNPNAASISNQVRDGVITSLASNATEANHATSAVDVPTRPTTAPVLRTLDLTLSPADLGSVRLRLSLSSNSLSIEAEASKASTAKLLTDDRPNLERGLKDAGYDISSMKITDASSSSSMSSNGWQTSGAPSRDGDPSRSGFMGRQDGEMQRRDGSPSDQAQRRPRESNPQPAPPEVAAVRSGNAVYI